MKVDKPCPHCGGQVSLDVIAQGDLLVRVDARCAGCGATGSAPLDPVPRSTLKKPGFGPAHLALTLAHDAALKDLAERQ
jgi:hypothetical protein